MEFHISRAIRERIDLDDLLFSFTGNVVFANVPASRKLAERLNALELDETTPEKTVSGASLFAMGLIDELSHVLIAKYRAQVDPSAFSDGLRFLTGIVGKLELEELLLEFVQQFPSVAVFRNDVTAGEWLKQTTEGVSNREAALEELILLWLANTNPAFAGFCLLFGDESLKQETAYSSATAALPTYFESRPRFKKQPASLLDLLRAPSLASPDSLTDSWITSVSIGLRCLAMTSTVCCSRWMCYAKRKSPFGCGSIQLGRYRIGIATLAAVGKVSLGTSLLVSTTSS